MLNAIPYSAVREVWGVAKVYETYVGAKQFEPDDPVFEEVRKVGEEFGATTGRPRQVNWLNIPTLRRAIQMNGVTHAVFNKTDVLREVGKWATRTEDREQLYPDEESFKDALSDELVSLGITKDHIHFSEHKDKI